MVWTIIKLLLLAALIFGVAFCISGFQAQRYYQRQGVVFCGYFPLVTDIIRLIKQTLKNPYEIPIPHYLKKGLGVDHLPTFSGTMQFGSACIVISGPEVLEDLYVKKNAFYTKHPIERQFLAPLVYNNIVNMDTDDPAYGPKRKILSSAFFKGKVQKMVTIIKETVLEQFTKLQAKGEKVEVNAVLYTQQLQSHIIMNILVGRGMSTTKVKYVKPGMEEVEVELADLPDMLVKDIPDRIAKNPLSIMFPSLFLWKINETDRRFFINSKSLRTCIRQIIEERQEKKKTEPDEDVDLVSILTHDDLYSKNIDDIIDDVIILFLAGSKTVQATTTNFICHMLHRPEIRAKVDAEVNPMLEKCKENFMELMTTELVEDLDYLKMCFSEVLRYDTPIAFSIPSCFSKDITVGGVNFKKDTPFLLALCEMHRNEKEWIDPDTFNPDRFDPNSEMYLRPDGSKRNPLSFTPFLGGKRVCLGKTFAELTLKFTLPLYLHHFDFEFINEEHKVKRPHYELQGQKTLKIPMNFITKNKVKQNFKQFGAVRSQKAATTKQGDDDDIPETF